MSQVDLLNAPGESEYEAYYGNYIQRVPAGNIMELMENQMEEFRTVLDNISEAEAAVLHEPYTWTIKQVVGHLIDVERVFAYRALRFACGDLRPIVGMEQNPWVENSDYETPTLKCLVDELALCREANVCMFNRFKPAAWHAFGTADEKKVTVRALAYILVGHIIHHLEIIKARVA